MLSLQRAKELNENMITDHGLILHSLNVCYAMGAMAEHFGEDKEHWEAIGYLHIPRSTWHTPRSPFSRQASQKRKCARS